MTRDVVNVREMRGKLECVLSSGLLCALPEGFEEIKNSKHTK